MRPHRTLVGLHRAFSSAPEGDTPELGTLEHRALAFAAQYYPAHPIAAAGNPSETRSIDARVAPTRDPEDYDSLTREQRIELILVNFLIPANRPSTP